MRSLLLKLLLLLSVITFTVLLALTAIRLWNPYKNKSDTAGILLLHQAYQTVLQQYVEKPDSKKLLQSMIDGMLLSLDPHSAYLPPEMFSEMEVQIAGAFGGVGIELGMKNGKLTAIAPIDDTPAFRAGIHPDDHIWKINGTLTRGMSINSAVKLMRGEKGTQVVLTVLRASTPRPLTFKLTRDIIRIKSVKASMIEPGYGLIRISQFQERTGIDFKDALKKLNASAGGRLKGLVLDLRFNPGGLIDSSVEVADCFVGDRENEKVIVSIKGRMKNINQSYDSTPGNKEPRYPIVVLINSGSASASEIVAGALQDYKRAIIMGNQSFGKGSVQSIIPMQGNAALKLTTARYYTPSGRSIQARGITPDIEVGTAIPIKITAETNGFTENDLPNRLAPESVGTKEQPASPKAVQPEDVLQALRGVPDPARDNQLKERSNCSGL
jgi:C-terminal peptidase (prc)